MIAIINVSLGSLTLLAAVWTLINLYKRMSLRFLRGITCIIIIISLAQITNGVLVYYSITPTSTTDYYKLIIILVLFGLGYCLRQLCIFMIIWLVTLKYWQTARQLSLVYGTQ